MALTPEEIAKARQEQEALNTLIRDYNKLTGQSMKNPINANNFKDAASYMKALKDESIKFRGLLTQLDTGLDGIRSQFEDILAEVKGLPDPVKKTQSAVNKLYSITEDLADIQRDIATTDIKAIKASQDKARAAFQQAAQQKKNLALRKAELASQMKQEGLTEKQLERLQQQYAKTEELYQFAVDAEKTAQEQVGYQDQMNQAYELTIKKVQKLNTLTGLTGKAIQGFGGFLEKIGFKGLGEKATEIFDGLKQQAAEDLEIGISAEAEKNYQNFVRAEQEAFKINLAKRKSAEEVEAINKQITTEAQAAYNTRLQELEAQGVELSQDEKLLMYKEEKRKAMVAANKEHSIGIDMLSEEEARMKARDKALNETGSMFGKQIKLMAQGFKQVGAAALKVFTDPLTYVALLSAAVVKLGKKFVHYDEVVSNMGKGMGLTRQAAGEMALSIKQAASDSGDLNINTDRLVERQIEISKQLGTAVQLTREQLTDQTYLAEFTGLQGEELANSYKASLLLGKSQREIFDTVNSNNDSVFQTQELFKEAVGTTGQIAMNLGNNPIAIAKAVAQAKRLGINLDTARSMADSTLDFESSIAAEMEAQLLTGKNINLNRARQLAFQGDQIGAAKEMLRQVGTSEEFSRMNVLAQKSLADAMGLSVDELSNQLREQEAVAKMEERRQELIAKGVDAKQAELQAQAENQTLAEVFGNIMSKIGDIVGKLLMPAMVDIRTALGDGQSFAKKLTDAFTKTAEISGDLSDSTGQGAKQLASMMPSAEAIGKGLGMAVNFLKSIPDRLKAIKESPVFQMLSGLFSSDGGKLAIAGAGIGVLGKMLMARGSQANPMYVTMSGGGLLDGLKNLFDRKTNTSGGFGKMFKRPVANTLAKQAGKKGVGAVMKNTGKKVYGAAAQAAVKKGTAKVAGKGLAKAAGKSLLKKIPLVGALAGIGFGLQRALKGDFTGAALEVASGVASTIPGVGTAASLAIDAGLAGRDIYKSTQGSGEPEPLKSGEEMGDFVIKSLPQDSLVMAGGTQFGKETNDLLRELITAVNNGGDVLMDGKKVGQTLSLASYKL